MQRPRTIITSTERRYDLDWLRVIAFGILIYFHAAVAFLPRGIPMTLNQQPSELLSMWVAFMHQFRLALLFFISGCGVCFALKSRDGDTFILERSKRLIIPLIFGIVALAPLMVYFEKQYLGNSYSSFADFYANYFTEGTYPKGNLSWHHFWFLAYLYLFCLLGWPLFKKMRGGRGKLQVIEFVNRHHLTASGIYLFIIPLLIIEIILRPLFPGFRDLIHDWASFSQWFLIFLCGFLFAYDRRLLDSAKQIRRFSLCSAMLTATLLFLMFWTPDEMRLYPFINDQIDIVRYLCFAALRAANIWLWVLVCIGYASRYLNRPSALLTKLNRAVYPVFCLHLPVLVVLEFYILPTSWSIIAKFSSITSLAVVVLACLYIALRPIKLLHPLVGMRASNKRPLTKLVEQPKQ